MVVRLDAHQSKEPSGLPWTSLHTRRVDDGPEHGDRSRSPLFRTSASAPTSPPSLCQVLKGPIGGSGGGSGTTTGESSESQNAGRRRAKIQVEIQLCQPRSASPTSRPTPKKSKSAPAVPQVPSGSENQGNGERGDRDSSHVPPPPIRVEAKTPTHALTKAVLSTAGPHDEEAAAPQVFNFAPAALPRPLNLVLRPAKRTRALHDVDGPGTSELPCKKRRLRLELVTSRLSQPYSWPATHILNRESGDDDAPMLNRFLKFAAMGALKKAGHQSAIVRKAAILNRVRIGVRQAAVLRGHTVLAGMAARGNSLSHGLQMVTTSHSATSARFPGNAPPYDHPYELPYPIPPVWRPHTTAFHPPMSSPGPDASVQEGSVKDEKMLVEEESASPSLPPAVIPSVPPPSLVPPTRSSSRPPIISPQREDEEDVAFPSPDLETRYVDYSDEDLDDVYADFGVLFGSSSVSPESASGGSEVVGGDHFYEEYLDELDGIRWVA
ncbi:hypothetical protein GGR52DRAFT_251831 [Hypoxylon sp. FL1284]|nr:hypothetical protein GGR52DRAFT_251831 [Hypoxylon sp. FL1284]